MNNNLNTSLQIISRELLLKGSFTDQIGLTGKMGIAIFFYHYSKYLEDTAYSGFASELIDEICNEISLDSSIYFHDGLSGIAWGFLYLIKNKFIDADENELLEDIDQYIMETDITKCEDFSFSNGLAGIICYFSCRQLINTEYYSTLTEYLFNSPFTQDKQENRDFADMIRLISKRENANENMRLLESFLLYKVDIENITIDKNLFGITDRGYANIGLNLIKLSDR